MRSVEKLMFVGTTLVLAALACGCGAVSEGGEPPAAAKAGRRGGRGGGQEAAPPATPEPTPSKSKGAESSGGSGAPPSTLVAATGSGSSSSKSSQSDVSVELYNGCGSTISYCIVSPGGSYSVTTHSGNSSTTKRLDIGTKITKVEGSSNCTGVLHEVSAQSGNQKVTLCK